MKLTKERGGLAHRHRDETRFAYTLLIPVFVLVGVLIIYPLIFSFAITFTDYNIRDLSWNFVGLDNYRQIPDDLRFAISLRNTAVYVGLSVGVGLVLSVLLGLVFNDLTKGQTFFKTTLLVPWAISPVVVSFTWMWLLEPNYGVANHILKSLGLIDKSILFLGSADWALYVMVMVNLWKFVPLTTLVVFTALQGLPEDQMKAAKGDGAGAFQRVRYIILPFLRPTVFAITIILIIFSFLTFDIVFVLSFGSGGPADSTFMLYFLAYKTSFEWLRMGYGATIGYMVTGIVVVLAILLYKFFQERELSTRRAF